MTPPGDLDLTIGDTDRHDRTRRHLGVEAHERVRRSRVLVVGAGAIGTVDFDVVSLSNLNRCVLFTTDQAAARTPKVEALAAGLARFAPDVDVRIHPCRIEEAPADIWDADLVLVAVDDHLARYHVNACVLGSGRPIPLVDAAMGRTFCQVQVLSPPSTACLACLWTAEFHARLMERVVRESCDEFFHRAIETFPALPVLSSLAGALAASEALAFLSGGAGGLAPRPGRALRFDLARRDLFDAEVLRNPECVEVSCRRKLRDSDFR